MSENKREDVEYKIERVKKTIREYTEVCHSIGLTQDEIDKRIDFWLDDLSRYLKELEQYT